MAEILLDRLDIVSGLKTVDRKRVAKIVEPKLLHSELLCDTLEIHPEGLVVDITSRLRREDKVLGIAYVIEPGISRIDCHAYKKDTA